MIEGFLEDTLPLLHERKETGLYFHILSQDSMHCECLVLQYWHYAEVFGSYQPPEPNNSNYCCYCAMVTSPSSVFLGGKILLPVGIIGLNSIFTSAIPVAFILTVRKRYWL